MRSQTRRDILIGALAAGLLPLGKVEAGTPSEPGKTEPSGPSPQRSLSDEALLGLVARRALNWRGFNLDKASLRYADLTGASLDYTRFVSADLTGALLRNLVSTRSGVSVAKADFSEASLEYADLRQAVLEECNMFHTRFGHALLQEARFSSCLMGTASFVGNDLLGELKLCQLTGATFDGVSSIGNPQLSVLSFTGSNLEGAVFQDCHLINTNFTLTRLKGARFVRCYISHSDFRRSLDLDSASFVACNTAAIKR